MPHVLSRVALTRWRNCAGIPRPQPSDVALEPHATRCRAMSALGEPLICHSSVSMCWSQVATLVGHWPRGVHVVGERILVVCPFTARGAHRHDGGAPLRRHNPETEWRRNGVYFVRAVGSSCSGFFPSQMIRCGCPTTSMAGLMFGCSRKSLAAPRQSSAASDTVDDNTDAGVPLLNLCVFYRCLWSTFVSVIEHAEAAKRHSNASPHRSGPSHHVLAPLRGSSLGHRSPKH